MPRVQGDFNLTSCTCVRSIDGIEMLRGDIDNEVCLCDLVQQRQLHIEVKKLNLDI